MRQMSAIELRELLASDSSTVKIDVRETAELKHGMLEDAMHIPMHSIPEQLADLEQYKNATIVLICRTGKRSDDIGHFLEQQGFTDVINLAGGMNAWALDVDTSMTVY